MAPGPALFPPTPPQGGAPGRSALILFQAGRLDEAIAVLRQAPEDAGLRLLLAELLLFAGEAAQADESLAALAAADASVAPGAILFRRLLRAELLRRQTWVEQRVPEFLADPPPHLAEALKALLAFAAGRPQETVATLQAAEAARPACAGLHDGKPFADLRDADDLMAGYLEALTPAGRYVWVSFTEIAEARFHRPKRLRDLYWRQCTLKTRSGLSGDIYVPCLYPLAPATPDGPLAVGAKTEWAGQAVVRGCGQRVWLIGDEGTAIREVGTLVFL
ncbi:type VI secretion system accessory protein TagJ [Acidisoma sp. C75]